MHGDDFTFAGDETQLKMCIDMMKGEYEFKVRGLLGPDKNDDKSITILNRCVEWTADGISMRKTQGMSKYLLRNSN